MGSTSSKFKKYLQHGDEFAAMQIYQSSPELRKNLDPNLSYGESHNHNTALHYAAKHGMKHLLRTFLNDLGGNPNKKNALNETVLHCACQLNQTKSFSAQERRAACVQLLLYWKGVILATGGREKVDLAAQDKEGNTALHWAASTGLKRCIELLLAHGAPLFTENNDKLTPCDLAMRGSHHDIAVLLESRMVFADTVDVVNEDEMLNEQEEVYSGLRSQDLQEAKDQLLVDTSDMLKIPLFTAEALLRNNEWSRELLLEKWMRDPVECCQLAGVQPPASAFQQGAGSFDSNVSPDRTEESYVGPEIICEICYQSMTNWEQPITMSCKHAFCKNCWESYLTTKIQDGDAHHILCPAYQCHILVPIELIERVVSPEMARRYLQFDIKAFVESNKSIKWCPVAGCGRAVRLPEAEQTTATTTSKSVPVTSHAVDCGNAHFFCWECLGEAHAPCGCKQWQEWQFKITEVKPEELRASCSGSEDAANFLWLVTNSKPCPNCKSPIQKNEGCNHMKCSKCKFDFCWVCQESWKRHSSATGGYFRCNRFEAVHKADEKQGTLISEALDRNNHMQEMSRFLHFYTRFKNHENSQKLEEPLLMNVRQKMEVLALGLKSNEDTGERGTKFIEDGVRELLKARRVLCGSYVYGYYLVDDGYNKSIFEFMQNELEEVTEKLSEMIARPYLRKPKAVIVQTTALARRKRHEFVRAVAQGLIPPETPPTQRKGHKKMYFDSDLSQTSAWLKDCEWPEYDDSENEESDTKLFTQNLDSSIRKDHHNHHQCGIRCTRHGCGRLGLGSDFNMELVIALEMSRLQMIEDRMKQAQAQQASTVITPELSSSSVSNNSSSEATDDQLRLAIQLSLQESNSKRKREHLAASGQSYQKTSADLTVDYFLKSLANRKIDFRSLEIDNRFSSTGDAIWTRNERDGFYSKPLNGKEDGRFQISDIHEKGLFAFADSDDYDESDVSLKRSHSTGDLCVKRSGRGTRVRMHGNEEPRYHLDSDHSSQHDDKPEEIARKNFNAPSSSARTKHFLLLQQPYPEEEIYYGQSSIEDTTTTTTSDSLDTGGIIESMTDDDLGGLYENVKKRADATKSTDEKKHNALASIKAKICSAHLPKTGYLTRIAVNKSIGLLSESKNQNERRNSDHAVHFNETPASSSKCDKGSPKSLKQKGKHKEPIFYKSTSFLFESSPLKNYNKQQQQQGNASSGKSNLRIKICKNASPEPKHALETDSSNEYESETGIPKSPTLFISGVSISRTPEPNKNVAILTTQNGRQSRSSSLSVPATVASTLNISSTSINNVVGDNHAVITSSIASTTATTVSSKLQSTTTPNTSPSRANNNNSGNNSSNTNNNNNNNGNGNGNNKENGKSKSASEPEREREMFRFPKSSTDGALSSVLHVQESNLSSDDFHEALFLLERSPKIRDSKRRKKSKKKDCKEINNSKEEASSAL